MHRRRQNDRIVADAKTTRTKATIVDAMGEFNGPPDDLQNMHRAQMKSGRLRLTTKNALQRRVQIGPTNATKSRPTSKAKPVSSSISSDDEWLTYTQIAAHLGLRGRNAAAARARRGGWLKRPRGKTAQVEVLVPGRLLAKRPALSSPTMVQSSRPATMETVAPMSVALEQQEFGTKMLQTVLELARAAIATAQVDATKANTLQKAAEDRVADLSARLEREEAERRALQQQKDSLHTQAAELREMLSAIRVKATQAEAQGAKAHAEAVAERGRAAELRRQLEALQVKKRRWWQF
jgi:hypothetical protein